MLTTRLSAAPHSKPEYVLELARELLDDVELSRLSLESLLLKAGRLAHIMGNEEMEACLGFELHGIFPRGNALATEWARRVGRYTDESKNLGYWDPLAALDARLIATQTQLQALRIPDLSYAPKSASQYDHVGPGFAGNPITLGLSSVIQKQDALRIEILEFSKIKSRVLAILHRWVSVVYHEKLFSHRQGTLFEKLEAQVAGRLGERSADALKKFPSVQERLFAGDPEAVSHALSTCRRMMDSFCDSIQPPSDTPVELGGEQLAVTAQHTKNRFRVYLLNHCASESRRTRLRQTMTNLYDRTSTGVHADVSPEEAHFLFFEVYLWIGEVLSLPELPEAPPSQPVQ